MNAYFAINRKAFPPRTLDDLAFSERLVLWAIRLWTAGYRLGNSPDDELAKVFEKCGIQHARQGLEEFMIAVTAGAARKIGVPCVCRHDIGEDELLLLHILRMSQPQCTSGQVTFLLEDLLTPTAISIAAVKAQALASAFHKAGFGFVERGRNTIRSGHGPTH